MSISALITKLVLNSITSLTSHGSFDLCSSFVFWVMAADFTEE
jgi:hypothetical protein